MARSYTLGEAAKILVEGTDIEAIQDLGRRFPVFTNKAMKAIYGSADDVVEFLQFIPEYVNPRKVEKQIIAGPAETDETEDTETDVEPDTVEETAPEKPKRRGRKVAKKEEPVVEEKPEEETEGKYAGKNAMELFKECKKRGIKAQPKKPVKYYVELLEEDDEVVESESADSNDDDDDWDI